MTGRTGSRDGSGTAAFALAVAAMLAAPAAQAALLSGFEAGLAGWEHMGDVSVQGAAIGLAPSDGAAMAFVSTMCDRNNPPALRHVSGSDCETTINEHPYSGVSSPAAVHARVFLGLPGGFPGDFLAVMPPVAQNLTAGESGALKTSFTITAPTLLSFDWNRIGNNGDSAYFSVWSLDPGSAFRVNAWLYAPSTYAPPLGPSGVDLCSRYHNDNGQRVNCDHFNVETGWRTTTLLIEAPGSYALGFALGEIAEGTVPTVLAVDNVRLEAPEPGSLALLAAGLAAAARRRRTAGRA